MTVRGHTFEHDYPPTPFNEPIRPLPEAALNAEATERTSNLGLVSFFLFLFIENDFETNFSKS